MSSYCIDSAYGLLGGDGDIGETPLYMYKGETGERHGRDMGETLRDLGDCETVGRIIALVGDLAVGRIIALVGDLAVGRIIALVGDLAIYGL